MRRRSRRRSSRRRRRPRAGGRRRRGRRRAWSLGGSRGDSRPRGSSPRRSPAGRGDRDLDEVGSRCGSRAAAAVAVSNAQRWPTKKRRLPSSSPSSSSLPTGSVAMTSTSNSPTCTVWAPVHRVVRAEDVDDARRVVARDDVDVAGGAVRVATDCQAEVHRQPADERDRRDVRADELARARRASARAHRAARRTAAAQPQTRAMPSGCHCSRISRPRPGSRARSSAAKSGWTSGQGAVRRRRTRRVTTSGVGGTWIVAARLAWSAGPSSALRAPGLGLARDPEPGRSSVVNTGAPSSSAARVAAERPTRLRRDRRG